jgi:hypothetical protein
MTIAASRPGLTLGPFELRKGTAEINRNLPVSLVREDSPSEVKKQGWEFFVPLAVFLL